MVDADLARRLKELEEIYFLATYARRYDIVRELNDYYRTLGVAEEKLLDVGDRPELLDKSLPHFDTTAAQ